MAWPPGAHASTFGGNPVSCAAALATITLLKDRLVANAADVGAHLMAGLKALADKHPLIGDVRGRGLMIGVELVRDRQTKERATDERDAVVTAAFNRGLLVLGAGKNSVRFSPPLVLTREQADTAVRIFDEALTKSKSRRKEPRSSLRSQRSVSLRRGCALCFRRGAGVAGLCTMTHARMTLGKTGEDLACARARTARVRNYCQALSPARWRN